MAEVILKNKNGKIVKRGEMTLNEIAPIGVIHHDDKHYLFNHRESGLTRAVFYETSGCYISLPVNWGVRQMTGMKRYRCANPECDVTFFPVGDTKCCSIICGNRYRTINRSERETKLVRDFFTARPKASTRDCFNATGIPIYKVRRLRNVLSC